MIHLHHLYHRARWARLAFVAAALGVAGARGLAQPPGPGAAPQVELGDVTDTRDSGGFGLLMVGIDIVGVPDGVERSRTSLRTATDDTGGDLIEPSEPGFGWASGLKSDDAIPIEMKNPARRATTVTRLEGEIEMLIPRRDPDATLEIGDWRKYLGQPLEAGALKRSHITLRMLSAAEYRALPRAQGHGTGREVKDNDVLLLVSDPEHRLAVAQFQNPDESAIEASSASNYDQGLLLHFESPLPNARLKLLIATPKAVVKVPFSFSNIELP